MAQAWRIGLAGAAVLGYALLSCWLMLHAANQPWAVAVIFGPLVLALAASAWQRRQWALLAACAAGVALLALVVARGGVDDVNRLYVLQYVGIHGALAWVFGSTLRPGGTALITGLALTVHTHFTPEMRRYTHWLTQAWTAYFIAMAMLSLLIYALAPWRWWTLFANLLTPAALAALFVGEHVQRYRRHPHFERVSLRAAIAAYRRPAGGAG